MATRRQAREWAFQMLFEIDMNPAEAEAVIQRFWASRKADHRSRDFANRIVRGASARMPEVDALIRKYAHNWDVGRMGTVERSVLRLAVFELTDPQDVPAVVAINEAVDLAKYFGTNESGRFVNGILDTLRKDLGDRRRSPGEPEATATPA